MRSLTQMSTEATMLAGGWALGAGACAVVDTLLAAMLVEGMAANGWAGSGTLLLASMVAAAHSRFPGNKALRKSSYDPTD